MPFPPSSSTVQEGQPLLCSHVALVHFTGVTHVSCESLISIITCVHPDSFNLHSIILMQICVITISFHLEFNFRYSTESTVQQ